LFLQVGRRKSAFDRKGCRWSRLQGGLESSNRLRFFMKSNKNRNSLSRKVLSGSVLRLCNLVAAVAFALLLMPLMVHRLGDRIYGLWSLAAAFIGYYGLIDLGLSSAVSQYLCIALGKKDAVECRAVFKTALGIQSLLGCVALVVTAALAAATQWLCHDPGEAALFWKVIAVLGVTAALGFPARVYGGLLEAQLRFDIQSLLDLVGLILRSVLILGAMWAGHGLLALAWAMFLASIPVMVLQVLIARREAPWARIGSLSFDLKRTKGLFSYSIYSFVTSIGDVLRFQVDPVVIAGFVSIGAVTHYRVASVFMRYFINVITSSVGTFQQVSSQLYGSGNHDKLEQAFFFATKVSIWISVSVGFILIFWGRPFILHWMGAEYGDACLPMVVLSIAVFLDVSQFPSISLLYATFNHRFYTYLNLAEGIINLGVSVALARSYGIFGVALGTLIAAIVIRIAVQPWWVCKAVGLPYWAYLRFVGWNVARCSCLMGVAAAASAWGLRSSYGYLISAAACAGVIYGAGSWFLVFDGSERKLLLNAITNRDKMRAQDEVMVDVPCQ
jgi:O-antigen/teichoic acid export membrane protein